MLGHLLRTIRLLGILSVTASLHILQAAPPSACRCIAASRSCHRLPSTCHLPCNSHLAQCRHSQLTDIAHVLMQAAKSSASDAQSPDTLPVRPFRVKLEAPPTFHAEASTSTSANHNSNAMATASANASGGSASASLGKPPLPPSPQQLPQCRKRGRPRLHKHASATHDLAGVSMLGSWNADFAICASAVLM